MRSGSVAVDEGVGEAAPVVGLRMVSTTWICGRGRGIRRCSGGWVKDGVDDADLRLWTGVRSCSSGWVKDGIDDADLRPRTGRQKLLRWLG